MKKQKIVNILLIAILVYIYGEKLPVVPMEEFNIPSAFGNDISQELNGIMHYNISYSIYNFKKMRKKASITGIEEASEQSSSVIKGEASTIGETREDRQLKSSKPNLIGSEKIVLISEEQANYGIGNITNIFFTNAKINDRSFFVVCKGKAEEMLMFKVEGYPSSADYIEGMIRGATVYNFLSQEYSLFNIYTKLDSEGEDLVLPYVEIKDKEIVFSGMAIFKGDKMAFVLPMEESKIMNILRGKKRKGILSLQEGPNKYINYDTTVKRKVKCNKKEGKYEFNIELDFQGDIIANTLYKDISKENQKDFEELMGKKIEKMCYEFLDKMKNVYKVDCLDLGLYGAAKYGRNSGVDWNKEVSNADIKVSVKVKIDKIGIGEY